VEGKGKEWCGTEWAFSARNITGNGAVPGAKASKGVQRTGEERIGLERREAEGTVRDWRG